jgi:ankyrin repeat protein
MATAEISVSDITSILSDSNATSTAMTTNVTWQEAMKDKVTKAIESLKIQRNRLCRCLQSRDKVLVHSIEWELLLYRAANSGNLDAVKSLIEWSNGADLVHVVNLKECWAPLLTAVQEGHVHVVRYMVEELGVSVNQTMAHGWTPLCLASWIGDRNIMRFLCEELGADVNQAMADGWTPLCLVTNEENLDMMRFLCEELGADVNLAMATGSGYTPLHLAVNECKIHTVRCLCADLGADVNRTVKDGWTPLILALQEKSLRIASEKNVDPVRCLIKEFDADVSQARIDDGLTPLMCAANSSNERLLKCLVHRGADMQAKLTTKGTAVDILQQAGASSAQIAYLEVRTYCANSACKGPGRKRCARCKQARFCSEACIHAHWPVHKLICEATNET